MTKPTLSLLLLSQFLGTGCSYQATDCQPGDVDCATADASGASDEWDEENNPSTLAKRLQYRLAELPKKGQLDKPVWAKRFPDAKPTINKLWPETYFPSAERSINNRWQGVDVASPIEKYDEAFNDVKAPATQPAELCGPNAKQEWDAYLASAGPATRYVMEKFQGIGNGFNGRDDDGNGEVDECSGGKDGFGPDNTPAGWWGLCHAWSPAAILEPEAQGPVTINGVTFDRSDIHALVLAVYDDTRALMLGGRCNDMEFSPDNTKGRDANDDCMDTNPGALHVILTNFLGIKDAALVMDRTAGSEVWNQPIYGYEVETQKKVTAKRAMECVGATGDVYTYNDEAASLYETVMNVSYLVEGGPSNAVMAMENYLQSDSYRYILEVSDAGKIIGGRYCTESVDSHPDFLWAPLNPVKDSFRRNPHVSLDKVRRLLRRSVMAE